MMFQGKEYRSSLTEDGNIESLGGELFLTPVKWLAAILGKPVPDVKKSQAYKQVINIHNCYCGYIIICGIPVFRVHQKTKVLQDCMLTFAKRGNQN